MSIRLSHFVFLLSACTQASLFLTPEQKSKVISQNVFSQKRLEERSSKLSLKLTGIFHRPDLDRWIVWINGKKIDSECPQSIQGWTICHVGFDYVTLRSFQGEELVLYLEDQEKGAQGAKQESPPDQSVKEEAASSHADYSGNQVVQSRDHLPDDKKHDKNKKKHRYGNKIVRIIDLGGNKVSMQDVKRLYRNLSEDDLEEDSDEDDTW